MARQKIPKVQPMMLRQQPDQFCNVINQVIDRLNELE